MTDTIINLAFKKRILGISAQNHSNAPSHYAVQEPPLITLQVDSLDVLHFRTRLCAFKCFR